MKVGLIGFPGSGKTTIFNALTGQRAETGYASRGASAQKPNLAVVKVPDARVAALAEIHHPKKTTYAEVVFVDVPVAPGAGARSFDQTTVAAMRDVDALVQVVRGFSAPAAEHPAPDLIGEVRDLGMEMTLADLGPVEKRLERLKKEKGKPGEVELLSKVR